MLPSRFTGYALAIGCVVAATAIRLAFDPVLDTRFPFATLFFAVLVSAWFGGFGPALLATGAGGVAAIWFLLAPRHRLIVDDVEGLGGLALYLTVSLGIALIGRAMRRARARAEAAASEASARREELRVTLQSIGDAVVTTDAHGCVTSMNAVAIELTGWTAEAARGRSLDEVFRIINEQTRVPIENPATRVLAEGRIVGLANHTVLIARDGTERPIDDSAAPIRDRDGALRGVVLVFRDVSERREAEKRIRSSEQDLSDFFENANVGLHWGRSDGIIERVNRAELEMLGYSRDEYVGHHIAEFHADAAVIADILARQAAGESLVGYAAQLRCKDGTLKDVLINSSVLWDHGRFVHTRCFTLDVTAHNRAEEARALLAAVVESSDDAIITKTLDGIVTSWNAGAERLFGYTRDEAVGRPITMIIPPGSVDEEQRILERLRRGERIEAFDTVRVTKSGRLIDISLRISPVRDRHGRIIGASKLARDITASREAQRALRESEERFRTLADNIAQFAWMADGSGSIFWYNKRWFDYTDTTLEQMKGWGWLTVHHPEHVERVAEKFRRCLRTGEVWEDTFPLRGADGGYRWFLSRAIPIRNAEGRVTRWFGTNTDVTAQREAEESLKEADRRKDEFLATLAHELRNPLAPLSNALEIMKRAEGNHELVQQAHAIMSRQMTHLSRLVDDLLDIARISRDRIELRRARVELASIMHQAVETCRPLADAAGLEVTVTTPPEPIYIDADAIRLAQVFGNLLNNACKYTERGGHVSLTARRDGTEAVVVVRDTGRGIDPSLLPRVFEMFTQVDQSADGTGSGLGIGLALARRLVQLHGGTVDGFSEGMGRGSEFVVRLPLPAESGAPAEPPPPSVEAPMTRRRVLIVDDNVDAAESLATLLQLSDHDTALAYDGESGVEVAEAFRPDVVLLDIGLPKLSGHEAARRIRAQPWGRRMVLVALTGWGQDEDRRKSQEAGFDYHMVKPIDWAALNQLLARLPTTAVNGAPPLGSDTAA